MPYRLRLGSDYPISNYPNFIKEDGDMDEIIIDKGCGLDVHKETVVACVMGSGIKKENVFIHGTSLSGAWHHIKQE